jgi:hypothetical protein
VLGVPDHVAANIAKVSTKRFIVRSPGDDAIETGHPSTDTRSSRQDLDCL